jgi:5-formyltetrahydrofolate cyclo-ligase
LAAAAYTLLPFVPASSRNSPRGKPVTRRTVLSRRDALTADQRADASAKIAERAHPLLAAHRVVALYAPKGSEVDTAALDASLRATGVRVVYPRVVDGRRELAFHEVAIAELVPSRFGLREPLDGDAVALHSIDAFCIPGLAFDRDGWRVGWGHGHYDATLAAAPAAARIGLAFECQLVEQVAHDPHDARVHVVVTEIDTYQARE